MIKLNPTTNFLIIISLALLYGIIGSVAIVNGQNNTTVNPRPDFEKLQGMEQNLKIKQEIDNCTIVVNGEYNSVISKIRAEIECLDALESRWWTDCALNYEKIEVCYNGDLKNFLKSNGRLTSVP